MLEVQTGTEQEGDSADIQETGSQIREVCGWNHTQDVKPAEGGEEMEEGLNHRLQELFTSLILFIPCALPLPWVKHNCAFTAVLGWTLTPCAPKSGLPTVPFQAIILRLTATEPMGALRNLQTVMNTF